MQVWAAFEVDRSQLCCTCEENCTKIWKTLSKNAVKVMSGQLKLGLGGYQEGRQKSLLSCILSFDGDSHRGRPVQNYEDEPRLCLFGLSLTFRLRISSANTWRTPLLQSEKGDCWMYHNVHLWTTPLEGQFPRTNRKGDVEESLLWVDFQSLPKALMSIAHVYPLHNVIRMRRQRSSRKACYGWTLIRSLPPLVVVV